MLSARLNGDFSVCCSQLVVPSGSFYAAQHKINILFVDDEIHNAVPQWYQEPCGTKPSGLRDWKWHRASITIPVRHHTMLRRLPIRQSLRSLHTTRPLHKDAPQVTWKTPFKSIRLRSPKSFAAGIVAATLFITFPLWFKQPLPADLRPSKANRPLPPPVRGGPHAEGSASASASVQLKSVEEPRSTTENFPDFLEVEEKKFRLVAWGVRTVSFLRIQVYNVGLYIPETEYNVLPTYSLSHISANDPFSILIRIFSYPLLLRIIPVRNTDFAHLRDGFVRSTTQRLGKVDDPAEKEAIDRATVEFKKLFPGGKLKKGEVLSVLQWGPEVRLYVGGGMEEDLGAVKNDEFARGLMGAYLVGENVVSPDLLRKLRAKVKAIAEDANELVAPMEKKTP